ncbi:MAG TPA: spermidine/putrescine ABC transporter substrate-binding protein [Gaiellales bacterium]|nr:spermidine/putrescine ABC transporter substrate-binding protein [Gaiellales bacterium]
MAPDDQSGQWLSLPMTRRAALRRGAQFAGLASLGLAAACGSGSSSSSSTPSSAGTTEPLSGTVTFANYPEWIGAHEVAAFEKANPGVKIHQVSELTSGGNAAQIVQIHQNQGSYDMALAGNTASQQLADGKLIQPVNLANIPNIKYIPSYFRKSFPWGVPTDYGKVGLGYRKDLMTETPTSWADLWDLAPKYSGKIIFTDYDVDVISVALLKLGYDINTTDPGQLEQAKQALLDIKPHVQAFLPTNVTKPLLNGSAVMTVDYDYDLGPASHDNPNVVWVPPKEGMPAYLEGWIAIAGTDKLPEVEAFMNFHLDPKNYADFVKTTGAAYEEQAANKYLPASTVNSPAQRYDPKVIATVHWERYLDPASQQLRNQIWEEVQAA